jgi:hypothetical protein
MLPQICVDATEPRASHGARPMVNRHLIGKVKPSFMQTTDGRAEPYRLPIGVSDRVNSTEEATTTSVTASIGRRHSSQCFGARGRGG